jgi:hypothetical protein
VTAMTAAQEEVALAAEIAVLGALMETFGTAWAEAPDAPSADPAAIVKAREAWAVPASNGAAIALAKFAWVTAPPEGTAHQLAEHLRGIIHQGWLAAYQSAGAGDFWAHVKDEVDGR